jgi:hypothetical protein
MKTERFENTEMNEGSTDLVSSDQIVNRISAYLSNAPLNIGKDDYCYVRVVRNHLEIGRAKIELEE